MVMFIFVFEYDEPINVVSDRKLSVLSRGLRGKKDLHGRPYTGNVWVFVEVRKSSY